MVVAGAWNPGQQNPAHAGPVKAGFLQQHAQQGAENGTDGVQNNIIHVGDAVIEALGELYKQGNPGCSGCRQKELLPAAHPRMQQNLEKTDRHEQQNVSEKIEGVSQPFMKRPERNPVNPFQRKTEATEEIGRTQKNVKQVSQIHRQHHQQNFQPDILFFFQKRFAKHKSQQNNRINLCQGKTDPGIDIQHMAGSLPVRGNYHIRIDSTIQGCVFDRTPENPVYGCGRNIRKNRSNRIDLELT